MRFRSDVYRAKVMDRTSETTELARSALSPSQPGCIVRWSRTEHLVSLSISLPLHLDRSLGTKWNGGEKIVLAVLMPFAPLANTERYVAGFGHSILSSRKCQVKPSLVSEAPEILLEIENTTPEAPLVDHIEISGFIFV